MSWEGKRVLVVGLARTGLAAAEYFARRGAAVTVNDIKPECDLAAEAQRAREIGAVAVLGSHPEELFLHADLVVMSPGVPLSVPPAAAARARGITVIGDIEVAFREMKGRVCAITGSNGKTTTTALTGQIFADAGVPTVVAGNIGQPLIGLMDRDSAATWFVLEMSSFQLETVESFRPAVASILNLTPDHLDRYPSFGAYADAKRRIHRRQAGSDVLVLNADDPMLASEEVACRVFYFSRKDRVPDGCFLRGEEIVFAGACGDDLLMPVASVPLKGMHNVENVMAAALMARAAGIAPASIRQSVESFQAVSHRLQFVSRIRGVDFYNDSKATNVDATIKAIESFPGHLILILGGKDKGSDYAPLRELCAARVKLAVLIGQAAGKIQAALAGACPLEQAETLAGAVQLSFTRSVAGDTVLLAPACASFDMFRNFEHRGEVFVEAVRELERRIG